MIPDLPGLRFQVLHSQDAAEAYRQALLREVRGAFNIAAEPVVDAHSLAELMHARTIRLPLWGVRSALAAAWQLHLVPAAPQLFDAVLRLPIMDVSRARAELGWSQRHSSLDALRELLQGLREGAGMPTPPLAAETSGKARQREIKTGVGGRP
jgi:UDP-glucose 4-epimerase